MSWRTISRVGGLALTLLLLLPAAPAVAQPSDSSAARFELGLATTSLPTETAPTLALEPGDDVTVAKPHTGSISLSELRAEAWALGEGEEDAGAAMEPAGKSRRFGRWLKKRWYVPVIAAVAVGVALDSGDNDAGGEED